MACTAHRKSSRQIHTGGVTELAGPSRPKSRFSTNSISGRSHGRHLRRGTPRLPYLADLGVTTVELMPVADFAGSRNWGYDGVCLFAPAHAYGHPDDLRALVDDAHALGLSVMLDVVYNHLGPEGAYITQFNPNYVTTRHTTAWGSAINLDDCGSGLVRRFILDNAKHWIREYHVDGLRLDATHALVETAQ